MENDAPLVNILHYKTSYRQNWVKVNKIVLYNNEVLNKNMTDIKKYFCIKCHFI